MVVKRMIRLANLAKVGLNALGKGLGEHATPVRCIEKKVLFITLQLEPRVGRYVCLCELTTRGNSKSTWWLLDVFQRLCSYGFHS